MKYPNSKIEKSKLNFLIAFVILGLFISSFILIAEASPDLVGSKESNVYHNPGCHHAKNIEPENRVYFDTPEDAIAAGYRPCKFCKPPTSSKPIARFTYSPTNPVVNEIITFDAASSRDYWGHIEEHKWDFGYGNSAAIGEMVNHSYSSPGNYTVTLTVTDDDSFTDTKTCNIEIIELPVVSFTYTPLSPITIMFNASSSYDPDGSITEYKWDFGDNVTGTGRIYNHTYVANGTYKVNLTVTDNDNLTSTSTRNVTISNVTPYDVCDVINDIGIENLSSMHIMFLVDLFLGFNSSKLDQIPPEHRPNGILKNPSEDDINAVGAYYRGNIVLGNYYAKKSCGKVCFESDTTGLVLAQNNSSVKDIAQKVAIGKEWRFLRVDTNDPILIRQKIKAEYDKETFEYLLIIGSDTEVPLEDEWELIYGGDVKDHVLDSLYYGNMNNDSFVELGVGRLPFDNESIISNYYNRLKVNGTHNYYISSPIYNTSFEKVTGRCIAQEFDNTSTFWNPTIEDFTGYLSNASVFLASTHGGRNSWCLKDGYFTKNDIPNISKTRPIVISSACLTAQGLGRDFIEAHASAFIGQYYTTGDFGIDRPLILSKKILCGDSPGGSVRDYLNYQIASSASCNYSETTTNYTIANINIQDFDVIPDPHVILFGDPSLEISPTYSNLSNPFIAKKRDILAVKIAKPTLIMIDNLVASCYSGGNEVEKWGVIPETIWEEIINDGRDWGLIAQFVFPIENVSMIKSGFEVVNESEFELEDAGIPFVSLVRGESMDFLVISEKMLDSSAFFNQREIIMNVTVSEKQVFDTGPGTYPSIMGTHNGTITPKVTIEVSKLYTYPCEGTSGHTEYAKICNDSWSIETLPWEGYNGDWHNLSFPQSFKLYANGEYNYTLRTGSYPQIIHEPGKEVTGGTINCTEFVDANSMKYTNRIPAIRLWAL